MATEYENLLNEEDLDHDEILNVLDDLVNSGQITRGMHRVLLTCVEVASEQ